MKKISLITMIIFILGIAFGNFYDIAITNFNDAFDIAKITDKKVILMFSTDSCEYCKTFKEETMKNEELQKWFKTEYILAEIQPDNNKTASFRGKEYTYTQLFGIFGARTTPTFVYLDKNQQVLAAFKGLYEDDIYIKVSEYVAYEDTKKVSLEEFLKANKNYEIKRRIVEINKEQADELLKMDPNVVQEDNGDIYSNLITNDENKNNYLLLLLK